MERSHVPNGRFALEPGEADLREVVRDSVEASRPAAEAKGIGVTVETGLVPVSAGDRDRLAQLFGNLVSNAVKHEPKGGRICVRLYERDGWAQAEVHNPGSHIPPDVGLTIVKAIVDAHGGRIDVTSSEGEGTTFCVALPLERPRLAAR